jgi:hypothetical protein
MLAPILPAAPAAAGATAPAPDAGAAARAGDFLSALLAGLLGETTSSPEAAGLAREIRSLLGDGVAQDDVEFGMEEPEGDGDEEKPATAAPWMTAAVSPPVPIDASPVLPAVPDAEAAEPAPAIAGEGSEEPPREPSAALAPVEAAASGFRLEAPASADVPETRDAPPAATPLIPESAPESPESPETAIAPLPPLRQPARSDAPQPAFAPADAAQTEAGDGDAPVELRAMRPTHSPAPGASLAFAIRIARAEADTGRRAAAPLRLEPPALASAAVDAPGAATPPRETAAASAPPAPAAAAAAPAPSAPQPAREPEAVDAAPGKSQPQAQPAPARRAEPEPRRSDATADAPSPAPRRSQAMADAPSPTPRAETGTAFTPPEPRTAAPEARPPVREAASATPAVEPTVDPPVGNPAPLRDLAFRLEGASEAVDVRLSERGGSVQVSVHTADADLAGALRQNLDELSSRLEARGVSAETAPLKAVAEPSRAADAGNQPGWTGGGRQDAERREDPPPRRRSPRQRKEEERKDFRWIVSSIR